MPRHIDPKSPSKVPNPLLKHFRKFTEDDDLSSNNSPKRPKDTSKSDMSKVSFEMKSFDM